MPADLYCTDLYLNIISSSLQFLFLTSDYYSCILTIIDLQENTQLLSTIDIRIKIPEESALIVLTTFYTFYIHEFEQDLQGSICFLKTYFYWHPAKSIQTPIVDTQYSEDPVQIAAVKSGHLSEDYVLFVIFTEPGLWLGRNWKYKEKIFSSHVKRQVNIWFSHTLYHQQLLNPWW